MTEPRAAEPSNEAPARREDVTSVDLDGEVVVYADGAIHKLDRIATMLWNAFDGVVTLRELAEDLATIYPDASEAQILDDIVHCVDALRAQGLLAPSA
jgi:hypothetical protein